MFLSREGPRWNLKISDFELDLIIRSLDFSVRSVNEDEEKSTDTEIQALDKALDGLDKDHDSLDRMLRVMWGQRRGLTTKFHRGFCTFCNKKLGPHEQHEHPRGREES